MPPSPSKGGHPGKKSNQGKKSKSKSKVSLPRNKARDGQRPTNADDAIDDRESGPAETGMPSEAAEEWEALADEETPAAEQTPPSETSSSQASVAGSSATVSTLKSSHAWPLPQANPDGSGDGASTSESSPRSQPTPAQTRPATTMGDNRMDPSNVLASSRNETQGGDGQWSLTEFVSYRCQNVMRISASNDSRVENERQEMENDLKIYLRYNRGLNALLPSRPGSRPESKETEQPPLEPPQEPPQGNDGPWQEVSTSSKKKGKGVQRSSKQHEDSPRNNPSKSNDDITSQTETPLKFADYDIVANHFQINVQRAHLIHVYKVKFGNFDEDNYPVKVGTGMWMEYSNKSKWERILREHGQDPTTLNGVRPVYDGGAYMVSNSPFAWSEDQLKRGAKLSSKSIDPNIPRLEVTITLKTSVDIDNYNSFVANDMRCIFPKDYVQVVLTLMRQYCVTKGLISSDRFYFEQLGGQDLDTDVRVGSRLLGSSLLTCKTGFFQSVRVLGSGLQLNVDAMSTAFYKPNLPLSEAWTEMIRRHYLQAEEEQQFNTNWTTAPWTREQVTIANRYWKNMPINSMHKSQVLRDPGTWGRDEQYNICKLTPVAASSMPVEGDYAFPGLASNQKFTRQGPHQFRDNLLKFMSERYYGVDNNVNFQGTLPAIRVSTCKKHFLPWGCCLTSTASRYAGKLAAHLKVKLDTTPTKRHDEILEWVVNRREETDRQGDQRPWAEKLFQVQLNREMIKVEALLLDKPFLVMNKMGERIDSRTPARQDQRLSYMENRGGFLMQNYHHMLRPSSIVSYAVLSFSRPPRNQSWEQEFIYQLSLKMRLRGLTPNVNDRDEWLRPLKWLYYNELVEEADAEIPHSRSPRQKVRDALYDVFKTCRCTPTILICFMTRKMNPEYATLKTYCDIKVGVPTQVVISKAELSTAPKDMSKMMTSVDNVLWKINVKCGGINFRVGSMEQIRVMRPNKNTILMGADVTHGSPSIAAVVATTDAEAVNYAIRIKAQNPNQERIEHLQSMVGDLFEVYHRNTNVWPDHIIFFRDGVSETQFLDTLRFEGTQILRAAEERFGPNTTLPKLFIILAVKRHHTRFFKTCTRSTRPGQVAGEMENIEDGTVIQDGVTHPREYEFFLCSHRAVGRGTVRPTKYHVLVDQLGIHPEQLYKLIYYLCFSFQRCQRGVALVTPVNYSHYAAFRAKLYMDDYVAEHPKPPAGSTEQDQARWLVAALRHDLNAHPNLRDHLWFL